MANVYLLILWLTTFVSPQEITFLTYLTKENDGYHLHMNCSSSTPSWKYTAEFLINNKTAHIIRYFDRECYINRRVCHEDECSCTKDNYFVYGFVRLNDQYNNFTCHMRFNQSREQRGHKIVETTALYNGTDNYSQKEVTVIRGAKEESYKEIKNNPIDEKKEPLLEWIYTIPGILNIILTMIVIAMIFPQRGSMFYPKRKQEVDVELQPFLASDSPCDMCTQLSVSVLCSDCEKLFCNNCCESHAQSNFKHKLFQIENTITSNVDSQCKICKEYESAKVCMNCKKELCESCGDEHTEKHENHSLKTLVMKHRQKAKRLKSVQSSDVKSKYKISIEESSRICGVSLLRNEQILICDYYCKQLQIYRGKNWSFNYALEKEPCSMASISDDQVAISYPNERQISLYEVSSSSVENVLDFPTEDKPFNIAYNRQRLIVEIGKGDYGKFLIYDTKGNKKYTINHDNRFAYFTEGNTIYLALDTKNEFFFVSALTKQGIFCVNFEGKIQWHKAIISPRSIIFVEHYIADHDIILSSKNSNSIYLMNSKTGRKEKLFESEDIRSPCYLDYNFKEKLLCVHVNQTDIVVYSFDLANTEYP